MNEDKNTAYQNLWDAAKLVLKGELLGLNTYAKKRRKSHSNDPTFHFKKLGKNMVG